MKKPVKDAAFNIKVLIFLYFSLNASTTNNQKINHLDLVNTTRLNLTLGINEHIISYLQKYDIILTMFFTLYGRKYVNLSTL
jgi:hypothetical protein